VTVIIDAVSRDRGGEATDPYILFQLLVRSVRPVGRSFVRVTFTGDDLQHFADNGDDQRIKLVLPRSGEGPGAVPPDRRGYVAWRDLPAARRCALRTYTVRSLRPAAGELDVDIVLHGAGGPGSRWANAAREGDPLLVVGPNAASAAPTRAAAWNPPEGRPYLLLGADETAVPAVEAILRGLPAGAHGAAVLEVPSAGDILDLRGPEGVAIEWRVRADRPHGEGLTAGLRERAWRAVAGAGATAGVGFGAAATEPDGGMIWDVPAERAPGGTGIYAWLAGEAGSMARLRRFLVVDLGLDRRAVAVMGYWKSGVAQRA
jgi:NADPH-dependent ferric siderophore reductase